MANLTATQIPATGTTAIIIALTTTAITARTFTATTEDGGARLIITVATAIIILAFTITAAMGMAVINSLDTVSIVVRTAFTVAQSVVAEPVSVTRLQSLATAPEEGTVALAGKRRD